MRILVTGAAGFIGSHTARVLLDQGHQVVGLDNFNDYYDVALKEARAARLTGHPAFTMLRLDVADRSGMEAAFATHKPDRVVHLAAQAGVRYSVDNPHAYAEANLIGFLNILEGCRTAAVQHLVYASTSSVYGANQHMPFSEGDGVGHPVSFYAATKRANEVMAHSYAHLYGLPCTGLRFFTVYGPWGRPDMALFKFTKAILAGEAIDVYNGGDLKRDFTYIDDIVDGIVAVLNRVPTPDDAWSATDPVPAPDRSGVGPFRIYNIGRGQPVQLMDFIHTLEKALKMPAKVNMMPMQMGDVTGTWANTSTLASDVGYAPKVSVEEGVQNFVRWYKGYYLI